MTRTYSSLVIIIPLLAAACINAQATCGTRSCLGSPQDQCCNDFVMGPTCFNPSDHTCVATTTSSVASGYRLCGSNEGACGSTCYKTNQYFCCNGRVQQNSQACSSPTGSPTSSPTSSVVTQAPAQFNCPGVNNYGGVNCSSPSLCCGAGKITPSCLPADGSKKCCTHFLGATQCDPEQVCGGGGGPGASSYAQCGPSGSTYCDKGTGQGAFCNAASPNCCGYSGGYGYCCPAGCACNNNYYNCSCPSSTTAPTNAPATSAPTMFAVPTTVKPVCSSGQALCGNTCYDFRTQFCCGNQIVCGSGQSCNIGQAYSTCCNHTLSYCGPPSFGVKCYDPATQVCCGADVYMPTVCKSSQTCRVFPTAECEDKQE